MITHSEVDGFDLTPEPRIYQQATRSVVEDATDKLVIGRLLYLDT